MKVIKTLIKSVLLVGLMNSAWVQADITHIGTVSSINNHTLSGDTTLSESWSWIQLSGLISTGTCEGSDIGSGDLAHIAFPDTEKTASTLALSAYLGGHVVRAIIDDTNLYQGKCKLKQLALGASDTSSSQVSGVSAAYWRIYITNNHAHPNVSISEMEFLDNADMSISIVGGIATSSSDYSALYLSANMFDSDLATRWASSNSASFPQWVAMAFASPVTVAKVNLTSADWGSGADSLQDFKFQWSSDGVVWNDIGNLLTGESTWALSEERTFIVQ